MSPRRVQTLSGIRAPHPVRRLGNDGAIASAGPGRSRPMRDLQAVLAHQVAYPGLAIDMLRGDRAGPAHGWMRAIPGAHRRGVRWTSRFAPGETVDLRSRKKSSPSCRSIRISSSSLSIIKSPTSRLARLNAFSSAATFGSSVRRFRAAIPPSRNSYRQPDSTAAGWPVSRLSASRLSPRSSRRTTSCLRLADQRFWLLLLAHGQILPLLLSDQTWAQFIRGATQFGVNVAPVHPLGVQNRGAPICTATRGSGRWQSPKWAGHPDRLIPVALSPSRQSTRPPAQRPPA